MFQSNNPAIDTNILAERVRVELVLARSLPPKQMAEATQVIAPAGLTTAFTRIGGFARNRLRRIPLLGDLISWLSWIVRARQIARMAFKLEENLSETRKILAETRIELDHLGQKFGDRDANLEMHLGAVLAASQVNARAIDALGAEIEALRTENTSLRQQIISQSHSAKIK